MITANMDTGMTVGSYFYLWNKEKGIFNSRKTATVKVYVCPECGYIELRAEKPKDLVLKKVRLRDDLKEKEGAELDNEARP